MRSWATMRWWMVAACCCFVGCGSADQTSHHHVEGKVSYRGNLVPHGMLLFQPSSGSAITAPIREDGSYEIEAPTGTYRVGVVAPRKIPDDVDPWKADVKLPPSPVPPRYGRPESSGIVVTVPAEKSTFDIVMN